MQNQILGFFMLTTVALGILAATQWKSSRDLDAQLAERQQKMDSMNVNLDGQRARIEALEMEGENLRAILADLKRDKSGLREATNRLGAELTKALAGTQSEPTESVRLPDGSLTAWYRAWQEGLVSDLYGELLAQWELDSEVEARVRLVLLGLQRQNLLAGGPNAGGKDSEATAEFGRQVAAIEADLKALLKPDQWTAFQFYSRTLAGRLWLRPLREELQEAGHPFTDKQFRRLLEVHADARQHLPPLPDDPADTEAMETALATRQATIHKRVLSEAPNFLDPEQVEALARHQE